MKSQFRGQKCWLKTQLSHFNLVKNVFYYSLYQQFAQISRELGANKYALRQFIDRNCEENDFFDKQMEVLKKRYVF